MSINKKLLDILREKGMPVNFQAGGTAPEELVNREIKKKPTVRAERLRDVYYSTLSSIDTEFPYWYTRTWRELEGEVTVVRRAEALKSAFSHVTPNIFPGEKLVMQRSSFYRGSFPMPWLSEGFFVAKEAELYNDAKDRGSDSSGELSKFGSGGGNVTESFDNVVSVAGKFGIRKEDVPGLVKLSKEWVGKSVDDLGHRYEMMVPGYDMKENLMKSVVCMFDSGYTLPQGREVMNYYFPLQYGLEGIKKLAQERKSEVAGNADGDGLIGMERLYYYEAVRIIIEGLQNWILNHAKLAKILAEKSKVPRQSDEYREIAECLEWIAFHQPRTFREALQLTYILHISVLNEDAISGLSPGRLGQVLYPWFEQDLAAGRTSEEEVLELLELYRVKLTCVDCFASTGVVGGVLSGNTFNNVTLGGVRKDGSSAANPLEVLFLEAGMTCETPQPTLTCLYDEKLPEEFLLKCVECTKTGTGYPAWVNNRAAMDFLLGQYGQEGMTPQEARAVALGGCLETSPGSYLELELNGKKYDIPGGAGQTAGTGIHFIALPKIIELVLTNGFDQRTGLQVYPPHNNALETFAEFFGQVKEYFAASCAVLARTNNIQMDIWRKKNMSVLNSFLKPDCLTKGHHIGHLGYRYNATLNIESCGTITAINSLAAIKKLVYDDKKYELRELTKAIGANFGFKTAEEVGSYSLADQEKRNADTTYDDLYGDCLLAPKYGNDDAYVDNILADYESWFCDMARQYESLYGKNLYACQISVSTHGPQGAATLASADGRLAGTTYADGSMSAYPGTDKNGPYALFSSATVWDHSDSQNSQMNLKIHPSAVSGMEGSKKLLNLTRSYIRKGGFHIQYNIVDSKVLKAAQAKPDAYRDLMVRVAGFTQYWCEIGKPIQDEVIARTEYEGV
jgi:4-hydroxyphenylacetate decarboxylase large subunit